MHRPHVILLGAGASKQAFPNGEKHGRQLPLMKDFSSIVPISHMLDREGISHAGRNFEEMYTELSHRPDCAPLRSELESAVRAYFASLRLPDHPTLYDHLVLSLRKKDVIATFNWDPFLIQAVRRNQVLRDRCPRIIFLHGNAAAGYCVRHNIHGALGGACSKCHEPFGPSTLLFPVAEKAYDNHLEIADAWRAVRSAFKQAFMVTIFGYGAPASDAAAVRLLQEAWGTPDDRAMEQFEIVDIRPRDSLRDSWEGFIHTHHYEVHESIYESWLFNHPRRSGEAYLNQYLQAMFVEDNPVPRAATFEELYRFFEPLIAVELAEERKDQDSAGRSRSDPLPS
jgi:hypothetical protein